MYKEHNKSKTSYIDDATVDAIETVNTLISNNVEFYDINGRKLNEAKQGLNIIKGADGKARKVFIK